MVISLIYFVSRTESLRLKKKLSFFPIMGLIGILAILIGFAKPFLIPLSKNEFSAPLIIYIHGAFAFAWVFLFTIQSFLIQEKKVRTHKNLGFLGVFIALGAGLTIIPAGLYAVEKELNLGLGETAISGIVGNITSSAIFLSLVTFGILYRKKPPVHKRLLLLSTLVLLWPAWFRFRHYFPTVERSDIWFAVVLSDSFILVSWIWDKKTKGKIHPVLLYVGIAIITEHILEVLLFDSPSWRKVADILYGFLL